MKASNFIYIYEDSLEELLYTIYYLIQNRWKPIDIVSERNFVPNLVDESFKVKSNLLNIYEIWKERVGSPVLQTVKTVFLSSHPKKELILYYFLLHALKNPKTIYQHRDLKCVNEVLKIEKYVHRETHKMKGFLRFKEMENGFLYAKMEPENCILFSLAYHFVRRMPNESFVIHDVKRNIYAFYTEKKLNFVEESQIKKLDLIFSDEELEMEKLWKTFFDTIAIQERENKNCQRNFMPKKYWKYLIEMEP